VATFPMGSYVGIQVTFWVMANNLMGLIVYWHDLLMAAINGSGPVTAILPVMAFSTVLGAVYGLVLGSLNYDPGTGAIRDHRSGISLLIKVLISVAFSLAAFAALTLFAQDLNGFFGLPKLGIAFRFESRRYTFAIFMLFYSVMSLLIGFINLVNKRYGPGLVLPLLVGKFQEPIQQERIFMFLDLRSSTSIAERLGHIRYSNFIRECFLDIDHCVGRFDAEVYQYAGDEVILTWKRDEREKALAFFFASEQQFSARSSHYISEYGLVPAFKAGVHVGPVTAVEIGGQKREIAYHGDTINTASRIQGLCNSYGRRLLVSGPLMEGMRHGAEFSAEPLGELELRGRDQGITVYGIQGSGLAA
jgi:adenylate cyclase